MSKWCSSSLQEAYNVTLSWSTSVNRRPRAIAATTMKMKFLIAQHSGTLLCSFFLTDYQILSMFFRLLSPQPPGDHKKIWAHAIFNTMICTSHWDPAKEAVRVICTWQHSADDYIWWFIHHKSTDHMLSLHWHEKLDSIRENLCPKCCRNSERLSPTKASKICTGPGTSKIVQFMSMLCKMFYWLGSVSCNPPSKWCTYFDSRVNLVMWLQMLRIIVFIDSVVPAKACFQKVYNMTRL